MGSGEGAAREREIADARTPSRRPPTAPHDSACARQDAGTRALRGGEAGTHPEERRAAGPCSAQGAGRRGVACCRLPGCASPCGHRRAGRPRGLPSHRAEQGAVRWRWCKRSSAPPAPVCTRCSHGNFAESRMRPHCWTCTRTRTHSRTCTRAYALMHAHSCTHTHARTCTRVRTHSLTRAQTHACTQTHTQAWTRAHTHAEMWEAEKQAGVGQVHQSRRETEAMGCSRGHTGAGTAAR